jgi:hypothetical protein
MGSRGGTACQNAKATLICGWMGYMADAREADVTRLIDRLRRDRRQHPLRGHGEYSAPDPGACIPRNVNPMCPRGDCTKNQCLLAAEFALGHVA